MAAGWCDRSRESGVEVVLAVNVRERGSWALDGREAKMEDGIGVWRLVQVAVGGRSTPAGFQPRPRIWPNLQLKPRTSSPSRCQGSCVYRECQDTSLVSVISCWSSFKSSHGVVTIRTNSVTLNVYLRPMLAADRMMRKADVL